MKLFALLIFVGFAAASIPSGKLDWQPGHKYEFKYAGRLINGIPELSLQFSGVAINATVSLHVKDHQTFFLTLKDAKYVGVNQKLQPQEQRTYDEGPVWRSLPLPEMSPMPSKAQEALNIPIFFKLNEQGAIQEVKVQKSDPLWSINFKKALVSLFQTQVQSGEIENMIQTPGIEELPYWTVKEQTIHGVCESTYQVNKVPENVIIDEPSIKPRPQACQGQEYYEIYRTIDYDKCNKLAVYTFYGQGKNTECTSDNMLNCNNIWVGSTTTRYIACGSRSSGRLSVQTIVNVGDISVRPQGHNTEIMTTGTHQNLTLIAVQPVSSFPAPGDQQTDLLYGFVDSSPSSNPKLSRPINILSKVWGSDQVDMGQKAIDLVKDMAKNIHGVSGPRLSESQLGQKLLTISRGLSMVKTSQELKGLYQKLQPTDKIQQTARQIFLDGCSMSGSQQAMEFFVQTYKEGGIKDIDMTQFLLWLPQAVITPTTDVLERLFELVTSDSVKSKPSMYNVGITSFTQLIEQVCVSSYKKLQYPGWIFGEMCSPESSIVQEKLIPYLSRESRSGSSESHKHIHILALGLLSHKNVIGELTPFVEKAEEQGVSFVRVLSIYSLAKVGRANPNLVTPIFQALFTNPTESTEIRIISFNVLLKLNPPTHVFNTIVHTTRHEKSMSYELLKTINIALYSIGNSVHNPNFPIETQQLKKKCKEAYVVVKKTYGIAPTSAAFYRSEFLKEFGVGYQGFFSWVSSQESVLPKNFFAKFHIFVQTSDVWGFEMGYRLDGVESLYEKVSDALNGKSGSGLMQQIREGFSSEWKEVIEKLQLKNREPSKFNAALYLRGLGSGVYLKSFTESTSEFLKENIVDLIKDGPSSISGERQINFQKSFAIKSYVFIGPTEMGFPIDFEIHLPVTVSLIGKMQVQTEQSKPSIVLDTKMLYSNQMTSWIATAIPFTNEYVATGVDKHWLLNIPGSMKLNLDIPEQKVSVSIKPENEARSGETDIVHFHLTPYTVKGSTKNLVPITMSQGFKPIKSSTPVKTGAYRFGESLGLSLKGEYQTESMFYDFGTLIKTFGMYKYCPLNFALFGVTLPAFNSRMKPSVRRQSHTLTINPTESSTKEIQMDLKLGFGSKIFGKPPHYHFLKVVSKDERLSQESFIPSVSSLLKKILPYRIHSEPMGTVSHHQNRVQKIKSSMDGLGTTQSSRALSLITKIVLKGNRARVFTYNLDIAEGKQNKETKSVEQKWNINFSNEDTSSGSFIPKKICIKGKLDLPLLPIWNINDLRSSLDEFYYDNKLEFGQSQCGESSIITKGVARSSQKQKSFSLESPELKKCQQLVREQVEGSLLSHVCQQARDQASALDQIEFTNEFKNIPKHLGYAEMRIVGHLKAYLWPYYNFKASSDPGPISGIPASYQTKTILSFKQKTPSFDLSIQRPNQALVFANVHIPEPYSLLFPLKGDMTLMSAVKKVSGSSIYPTCKVDHKTVVTFDNQTVPLTSDKCYHLLTADCSKYKRFGVSVRNVEGGKKEVKIYLKKTVVKMEPTGHEGPKVLVKGEPIEVRPNQEAPIKVDGNVVATVTRTVDGVVVLKAPSLYLTELAFNGKLISVVPSPMLKNKMCGLCGDYNQEINGDVSGPMKCMYSKPELKVASYRISSESCPPLPDPVRQELMRETEQCSKLHIQSTKIAQGYKVNTGRCTVLRHLIMQHKGEICISKVPVTKCGPSCKTIPSELVEKSVPFACLKPGSRVEYLIQKVKQGERVEELENMPTAYETKMTQPRHCVHALVSGSYE